MVGAAVEPRARHQQLVLLSLLLFTLVVRLATTPMIEVGGDAVRAWFNAKQLTLGISGRFWEWDHHSVRLAVVIPTWLTQELFGLRPEVYYILPLAMSLLQVALLHAIGRRLGYPTGGFVAAVCLVMFPQMERAGSQLLSEVFSGAYVLLGAHLLLRYRDAGEPRTGTIALMSGALFLAYLAKITNVLFVPGFALAIWILGRSVREVGLFLGILVALFCSETLLYHLLTEHRLGQLSVISGSHLSDRRLKATPLLQFFTHFRDLAPAWKITLLAFLAAATAAFTTWRKLGKDVAALASIPFGFLILQNFAVTSLDPLVPAQRFLPRYMLPALPLVMLVIASVGGLLVAPYLDRRRARPWLGPTLAGMLLVGLGLWVSTTRFVGLRRHPLALLSEYAETANAAFARGVPVVSLESHKTPTFFVQVLWDGLRDETFAGEMPEVRSTGSGRRKRWFVVDPLHMSEYAGTSNAEILAKWKGRKVVLTRPLGNPGKDMGARFEMRMARLPGK